MKFEKIREAIEQASTERIRKNSEFIDGLTAGKALSSWSAADYLTPKTAEVLKACDPEKPRPAEISAKCGYDKQSTAIAAAFNVECFYEVFANCGYQFKRTAGGRAFDGYVIERRI